MRRCMQLAYLFHQYAKSLLSTDGRIADCTVRPPGVERTFSSIGIVISRCTGFFVVVNVKKLYILVSQTYLELVYIFQCI